MIATEIAVVNIIDAILTDADSFFIIVFLCCTIVFVAVWHFGHILLCLLVTTCYAQMAYNIK
jgi:hypothetical protein